MKNYMNFLNIARCPGTISYLLAIFFVNLLFPYFPVYHFLGPPFSAGDITVGVIYIARDFAQREIGKNVLYVMMAGCAASYLFAGREVVIASTCAFVVGELIDWAIYTFSGKPFSQRLLTSSLISIPADTVIFLSLINQLNSAGVLVMILAKAVGVMSVWAIWRTQQKPRLCAKSRYSP
jgi:uncharacterized PurR-regulated membrane protein YhhQ (DUF165 family)